jgi:hypothetical protein
MLAGTFTATGNMTTIRVLHTATLLPSGKVLIAGGAGGATNPGPVGSLATAELYDPATGSFSPTGAMTAPRRYTTLTGTAILLPSGKILIAGGVGAAQAILATAELYNPATGSFNATGSMAASRFLHTATLLQGGAVLVAGGVSAPGELASAELYAPATGSFSATGSMTTARLAHTETLLPDGMVLITGGNNAQGYLASAELYDPVAGSFSATGSMATARRSHTATLLPSGAVLVAGGESANAAFASAELYVSNNDLSCIGFEPPMDQGPVTVKKSRALPLKAMLADTSGNLLTDTQLGAPPVIQVVFTPVIGPAADVTEQALSAGAGTEGNQFTFGGGKWQYNLLTKNYTASGTYTVSMVSGDPAEYSIAPTCMAQFVIQ